MPHGGARRGAGRPKKPLELKLLEGTWRKDRDGELPTGVTRRRARRIPTMRRRISRPDQRALWADLQAALRRLGPPGGLAGRQRARVPLRAVAWRAAGLRRPPRDEERDVALRSREPRGEAVAGAARLPGHPRPVAGRSRPGGAQSCRRSPSRASGPASSQESSESPSRRVLRGPRGSRLRAAVEPDAYQGPVGGPAVCVAALAAGGRPRAVRAPPSDRSDPSRLSDGVLGRPAQERQDGDRGRLCHPGAHRRGHRRRRGLLRGRREVPGRARVRSRGDDDPQRRGAQRPDQAAARVSSAWSTGRR